MRISEKALGLNHPITAWIVVGLSNVLRNQKKYREAEDLIRAKLLCLGQDIDESFAEKPNFNALILLENYATILDDQDDYKKALRVRLKLRDVYCQTFSEGHLDAIMALQNLGYSYQNLDRYDDAEGCFREAWELRQKVLGPDHRATLLSASYLGKVLIDQETTDKAIEAEIITKEVFQRRKAQLGDQHEETLISAHNLGRAFYTQKKWVESEHWLKLALRGREASLGEFNSATQNTRAHLGGALYQQHKFDEALAIWNKELEGVRKSGPDRYDVIRVEGGIAMTFSKMGRTQESGRLYEEMVNRCHEIYQRYKREGNISQAVLAREQTFYIFDVWKGRNHQCTRTALANIVRMHVEFGRHREAEKFLSKLLEATDRVAWLYEYNGNRLSRLLLWEGSSEGFMAKEFLQVFCDVDGEEWLDTETVDLTREVAADVVCRDMGEPVLDTFRNLDRHFTERKEKYCKEVAGLKQELATLSANREEDDPF